MKIWVDYDVKDFDDNKVEAALEACKKLCNGCETGPEKCFTSPEDCVVKNAIESIEGMIRVAKGIKRYSKIKGLNN